VMPLLQRYILVDLLKVFAVSAAGFTLLLVFAGVYVEAKEHGLGPMQILQILPFIIPTLLPFTIPTALLLTVCVVYGRLSGDQEIIAAKAAGIHIISVLWPAFLLGVVLSIFTLVITDQMIPWSMKRIQRTIAMAVEDIFFDVLKAQNQLNLRDQGLSITVMDVRDRTLYMPTFRYMRGNKPVTVQAKEARLRFDLDRDVVVMEFKDGYISLPDDANTRVRFRYDAREFPLPNRSQKAKSRDMTSREILAETRAMATGDATATRQLAIEAALILASGDFDRFGEKEFAVSRYQVDEERNRSMKLTTELHNRISMAFGCFFFVLVGAPFAVYMAKNQFLTSFLFCFVPILVVYYPLSMMAQNLSKVGKVDPSWAVWLPNGALTLGFLYIIRQLARN
jgi:lipopolysaccharide export system permease protein